MKHLTTHIEINASVQIVWKVLMDFKSYPEWNPFIQSISGDPIPGSSLNVVLQAEGLKPMHINPICVRIKDHQTFAWKGKLLFKGLFDGEHVFDVVDQGENKTLFNHHEKFTGILIPLTWNKIGNPTKSGFEAMNKALKERCESMR